MPDQVANIVIWTSVAAFVACVIAALAILFEWWTPKHPDTRKWLVGLVLASVVGAVVGFNKDVFASGPAPELTAAATGGLEAPPVAKPSSGSSAEPSAPPPPSLAGCALQTPSAVREWADAALGPRPNFRCVGQASYPPCVAELRGRPSGEVPLVEARACGDELEEFRRAQITSTYAAKATYETRLETAEVRLRVIREPADEERRDYVVAELARLRGDSWAAFVEIDRRSRDDLGLCQTARKCVPGD